MSNFIVAVTLGLIYLDKLSYPAAFVLTTILSFRAFDNLQIGIIAELRRREQVALSLLANSLKTLDRKQDLLLETMVNVNSTLIQAAAANPVKESQDTDIAVKAAKNRAAISAL